MASTKLLPTDHVRGGLAGMLYGETEQSSMELSYSTPCITCMALGIKAWLFCTQLDSPCTSVDIVLPVC